MIVKRRYKRGLQNFFTLFMPVCDYWEVIDNSGDMPDSIVCGKKNTENVIYNADIWHQIKVYAGAK